MIKRTGAGVNHIMVSGNVIQHQTRERPEQEAPTTLHVEREKARIPASHIITFSSPAEHVTGSNPKMA